MKARFTVTAVVDLPDDMFGHMDPERLRSALEEESMVKTLNWLGKHAVEVKSTATLEGAAA